MYPALPPEQTVKVFSSERDVGQPYQVVGVISHTDPGKYQVLTLGDAIPRLIEKARALGADGSSLTTARMSSLASSAPVSA